MARLAMIVKNERKRKKSPIQFRNRCSICGRSRAYNRRFGICRLCLRKLAYEGKMPGVVKSSW